MIHQFSALRIVLLLTFCNYRVVDANGSDTRQRLCPQEARFNLFNATKNDSGLILENGDFFPNDAGRIIDGRELRGCICDLKPCLALRPPEEKNTMKTDYVVIPRNYTTNLTFDDVAEAFGPEEWLHIIIWSFCPVENRSPHQLEKNVTDDFYLHGNGSLLLNTSVYCLRLHPDSTRYTSRVCFSVLLGLEDSQSVLLMHQLEDIGGLVSVPFIIATVIVYSILPELRNIHGTTLRCYLCCLAVTNVAMAFLRIPGTDMEMGPWCLFLGLVIYSSFISGILWLNVICLDLWWRFGGFGFIRSGEVRDERKTFFWYSLYVWGTAVVMTAICIGTELLSDIPESGFILGGCPVNSDIPAYESAALYYFGPLGLIFLCNTCLFVSTSIKIYQHEKSTRYVFDSKDSRCHNHDKKWFILHLKLFVVMGISWSTDPISWLWKGPKYFWLVTDMLNSFQGLLIFLIFVCKKIIWVSLKERCGDKILRAASCRRIECSRITRNHTDLR